VRVTFGNRSRGGASEERPHTFGVEAITSDTHVEITLASDDSAWLNEYLQKQDSEFRIVSEAENIEEFFSFDHRGEKSAVNWPNFCRLLAQRAAKALRRKLPYLWHLCRGLVCVLIVTSSLPRHQQSVNAPNGWGYVAFSMQVVSPISVRSLSLFFSGMLLAEETERAPSGRPGVAVHRWELYLAKAAVGLIYMIVLSFAALLFSMALAKIHFISEL